MTKFVEYNYVLPEWALAPIFNDDRTGLTDGEEAKLDEFLSKLPKGHWSLSDLDDTYFRNSNDIDGHLGGNVVDATFHQNIRELPIFVPLDKTDEQWYDVKIRPCIQVSFTEIEQALSEEEAHFWGAYVYGSSGQGRHIADLATKEQAEDFQELIYSLVASY